MQLSDVFVLLTAFQSQSKKETENILEGKIDVKWISKFSGCLPDSLAKKTICEKSLDTEGLVREMSNVTFSDME